MLAIGGVVTDEDAGMRLARETLASGKAWERFKELIVAQGGDPSYIENPGQLPMAAIVETVAAPRSGYLSGVHARMVGETAVLLGAGREKKGEPIDHAVGVVVHHKVGDRLEAGQPLFTIHANHPGQLAEARQLLLEAHTWSDVPRPPLPLFYGVIR
jgi:pyrimidine-nucleoside phosphorylase